MKKWKSSTGNEYRSHAAAKCPGGKRPAGRNVAAKTRFVWPTWASSFLAFLALTNPKKAHIIGGKIDIAKCGKDNSALETPKRAGDRWKPGGKPSERDHFPGRAFLPAASAARRALERQELFCHVG